MEKQFKILVCDKFGEEIQTEVFAGETELFMETFETKSKAKTFYHYVQSNYPHWSVKMLPAD
ncbi:hypothetical protein B0H94_10819 [Salsuginibacillus halophilus]|uniref:Uncharacterized protein n=1 Tax=Salsuginibacillus halophilus TaxID=517424 RepID=A0A2P8HDW1_9BACI|nr:hypothetical protein [Salsuginibacillus halophilus]PSL44409.1 hypothetical protein B0H94_10819 [Salsuginibacillus halophilus]